MFNYNSPIVNNTFGYNMGGQQPIPPNPMGNIVNIGNSGYMSGNYQNRYISPFQMRNQQQAMVAQQREDNRKQADMFKRLSKNVHKGLGEEISEEALDRRYNPEQDYTNSYQQQDQDEISFNKLNNLERNCSYVNPYLAQQVNNNNYRYEQMEQNFPKDMTLGEFFDKSYIIKYEQMEYERMQNQRDLTRLYDRNANAELRKMHGHSAKYFNSIFTGNRPQSDNIDDMTVTLSNHLVTEQQKRKEEFLRTILQRG